MKLGDAVENFKKPPHPKNITLDGETVRVEPVSLELHLNDLFESNSIDKNGVNWQYLPYGPFKTINDYSQWLQEHINNSDMVTFAIVRKYDNKAVGILSYMDINTENGTIEIGHINYSPLLQKTKAGSETMYLMMKWVFENGYRRYQWRCNSLNTQSRKTAQRLGFSYEGVSRQLIITKGRNRNTAWFAVIDKEWSKLKLCFEKYLSSENYDNNKKPIVSLSSLTKPILYKIDDMDFS